MPVQEFNLIYSDHIRSAFEVYAKGSNKLLGHITFCVEDSKAGEFCYTPFGQKIGRPYPSIKEALEAQYKTEVRLHFSTAKA